MTRRLFATSLAAMSLVLAAAAVRAADSPDAAAIAAVRKSSDQLVTAFNAGKVDDVVGTFLAKGELIDEVGTVYQGTAELKDLLTKFYEQFPGAKLTVTPESVRLVGPVAIDEGTRTISNADGSLKSHFRYIGIWAKSDKGWQLASLRDFVDEPAPSANDNLQPLAWLVGDWINEGVDGKVAITYRWSDDKNYLLGDFQVKSAEGAPRHSTQRIGWDPSTGSIRSWLFDSDGGFAEGDWTLTDEGIVIKSESVNADGTTATATLDITSQDKDHFTIEGTDRIVGGAIEEDFELTVTRRPPAAAAAASK